MTYSPPRIDGIKTLSGVIQSMDTFGEVTTYNTAPGSTAYPLANLAFYVPFSVSGPCTAREGWCVTGATAGGNFDIGIYDSAGSRLTSSGSTARTASAINNTTAMTDYDLKPGLRYFMAFSADGTNNYFGGSQAAGIYESHGVLESTSSFVLPASPTLSRTTRAFLPLFGLNLYTVTL